MKKLVEKMNEFVFAVREGEKARVTDLFGRVKIVEGPCNVFCWNNIQLFEKIILDEKTKGFLIDENGIYHEIFGPKILFVHPEARFNYHRCFNLASHEAMVVIDEDGKPNIYRGTENPQVWVNSKQRVHEFRWTGSAGDTENKTPGALKINVLRIQDTQTYMTFPVRTKDNVVIELMLMVYFGFGDLQLLIKHDDPFGAMFNKIIASLVNYVATLPFDEFKDDTNGKISSHDLFNNSDDENLGYFGGYGLQVQKCVVRSWHPVDREVQRILDQAATIQTQKGLDEANHERNMQRFVHEDKELDEKQKLAKKRIEAQKSEGLNEAEFLKVLFEELRELIGDEAAKKILVLKQASKAGALYLPNTMLEL